MSHEMLRPFIVKVSVLGYFPLCVCLCVFSIELRINLTLIIVNDYSLMKWVELLVNL